MKYPRLPWLAALWLPSLAAAQFLPSPPPAVTKAGRFGFRYTFISPTLLQQGLDNEPNHRLKVENLGTSAKTNVRVDHTGLNADGSVPTLSGGGFAVFPNGGTLNLRAGDTTAVQGWSSGWRECGCITDGVNDKLVRFIITYDSAYYGPDGLKDGDITLRDTVVQPVKIVQRSAGGLSNIQPALQTDPAQTLSGSFVVPGYLLPFVTLLTVRLSTLERSFALNPGSLRTVDSLGNRYTHFMVTVNPRSDYLLTATFQSSLAGLLVPPANIVVPTASSHARLNATALPYGRAQFSIDSVWIHASETGFWRTVFAPGDSSVTVFPGQENWLGATTAEKNANRVKSKVMKFSVAQATFGAKRWEKAIPFESWGGAVSQDGKVVVYMINQRGAEANLQDNPSVDWVGVLDGTTGQTRWGLRGNAATMEGLEVGVSSRGDYIALGTTGSGRLTLYRNNGGSGTFLWSNVADYANGNPGIGQVRKIVFSADDRYVYTGSGDMYLRKYRVSDGTLVWKAYIGGWPFVNGLAIANGLIATGTKSRDRTLVRDSDGSVVYFSPAMHFDVHMDSAFRGPVFGFGPQVTDATTGRAIAHVGSLGVKHAILDGQFAVMADQTVDVYSRHGGSPLAVRKTWVGGGSGEQSQSGWASPTGDRVVVAARDLMTGSLPRNTLGFFRVNRSINRYPSMDSIGSRSFQSGDTLRFKVGYRDFSDYDKPDTDLTLTATPDTSGLRAVVRGDSVIVYAVGFTGSTFLTVRVAETSTAERYAVSERIFVTVSCTPPAAPSSPATSATYCVGEAAAALTATPPPGSTLRWYATASGGAGSPTAPTPSTATAGTFTYYAASTVNGCESPARLAFTVTVKPAPAATATGDATVCLNAAAPAVTFTGSGASAIYTFTYTVNGGAPLTAVSGPGNSATVAVPTSTRGSFVYTLTRVASANGCATNTSASVNVRVNPVPSATITGGGSICHLGAPATITLTGSGGDAPYTFTLSVNGGPQSPITTTAGNSVSFPTPIEPVGTRVYTLHRVSDANGTACQQNLSATVTLVIHPVPPKPTITREGNGNLVSSAPTGNQWYRDGSPVSGATGTSYLPTAAGNYTVVVTLNGCPSAPSDPVSHTPTGLVNLGGGQYLRIWPNPAETVIRIEFRIQGTTRLQARLLDMQGKLVWKNDRIESGATLPADNLAGGSYILQLSDAKGKVLHREQVVVR
jgi:hypothetical protein